MDVIRDTFHEYEVIGFLGIKSLLHYLSCSIEV